MSTRELVCDLLLNTDILLQNLPQLSSAKKVPRRDTLYSYGTHLNVTQFFIMLISNIWPVTLPLWQPNAEEIYTHFSMLIICPFEESLIFFRLNIPLVLTWSSCWHYILFEVTQVSQPFKVFGWEVAIIPHIFTIWSAIQLLSLMCIPNIY